ncbi:hypothetical protein VPH35_111062 [Triticum aestivum]
MRSLSIHLRPRDVQRHTPASSSPAAAVQRPPASLQIPRSLAVDWRSTDGEPRPFEAPCRRDDVNERHENYVRDGGDRGRGARHGRDGDWRSSCRSCTLHRQPDDDANSCARSPPPSPRTTSRDIIEIVTIGFSMVTPPPSPRTTSLDIIEIDTTNSAMDRLCESAACLDARIQASLMQDDSEAPKSIVPRTETRQGPATSPPGSTEGAIVSSSTTREIVVATLDPTDDTPELVLTTPSSLPTRSAIEEDADLSEGTPIFIPRMPALLPSPIASSTPPRAPKARRKTLAGVSGLQLIRHSPRLQAKNRSMPIAKLAEKLLCHRMGIVAEGEPITEAAIVKFASLFKGRLPDIAIAALRALFRLDCDLSAVVEDALVQHGGQGGLDANDAAMSDA